jgi:hypothetical protein
VLYIMADNLEALVEFEKCLGINKNNTKLI